tara:strand:+ start:364 stop:735 length:372 start_codon:yes stop_codon:yes gene_type:complete
MSKIVLLALGWICVSLGFIGIFVPGLPTTIFLIIALWAFTKSSKRLRNWLLNHKRFGPILRNWQEHRVVPLRAKILMVILQISVVIIVQYTFDNLIISFGLAAILVLVASYVLSLPSKIAEIH